MTFELRNAIAHLNAAGGFNDSLNLEKVEEAAARVPLERVEKLLKDLEAQKDTIKDATAWVTSALRKASGGASGGRSHMPALTGAAQEADQKLRKRIGWLNGDGGGFDGAIIYNKVVEASGGLPFPEVMRVLKSLEEKKGEVKDPNAWVCVALKKAAGRNVTAGAQAWSAGWGAPDPEFDAKLRKRIGWLNGDGGGFAGVIKYDKVLEASAGVPSTEVMRLLKDLEEKKESVKDPNAWICVALRKASGGNTGADPMAAQEADQKLRKRIGWLNGDGGGFGGVIKYDKVLEASGGVASSEVMRVLKDLEEKKADVKDPNAWVCVALRKAGGGQVMGAHGHGAAPPAAWAGITAWAADVQSEDQKLRKRIGWLNGQGGFDGAINYDKVMEASGGLEFSVVFEKLKNLEEKTPRGSVTDPTAWVCAGLRKATMKSGGLHPAPMNYSGMQGGFNAMAGAGQQWGGGGAGAMDADTTSRLHKRVKWLNDPARFNSALIFDKVVEAGVGLDGTTLMKVLKELEEKGATGNVKDPLAYVTAGFRKAGGGGRGGGMPGVRKTIQKTKHIPV